MENILTPSVADQSALALYDKLVGLASTGTYIAWNYLAQLLRAEAARFTGDAARKRLDRAADCEDRARRAKSNTVPAVAL